MRSNKLILLSILIIFVLFVIGFWYWRAKEIKKEAVLPATYQKIFDYKTVLSGKETTAKEVNFKLAECLNKNRAVYAQIAGTQDPQKLRALFIMNFLNYYSVYGKRDTPEKKDFKHLFWNTRYNNCGTNTMILAMLLKQAGYEIRSISINNGNHGYVEVKFRDGWQILDPTTNIWISASTEELIAGNKVPPKTFYIKSDQDQNPYYSVTYNKGWSANVLRQTILTTDFFKTAKIDKYYYVEDEISQYAY